jgi:hypothetical protein
LALLPASFVPAATAILVVVPVSVLTALWVGVSVSLSFVTTLVAATLPVGVWLAVGIGFAVLISAFL